MSDLPDDDCDLAALRRLISEEADRRRRARFGATGDALRAAREGLGVSQEDAARALHLSASNLEAIESGMVRLDVFCFADYLRALLEAEGVPRRGAACRCEGFPDNHHPECRVHAMCSPQARSPS